jgi:hypothetical protein
VVGAEGGSADLKGALMLGSGAGQAPQLIEHAAEIVVPRCHLGVVGAEGGSADLKGALMLGSGAG